MNLIETIKKANSIVNHFWNKGLFFFWIIIIILFIGSGVKLFPDYSNLGEEITDNNPIDIKNCKQSTQNTELDLTPLKTNIEKGKYDLILDTDSGGVEKNEIPTILNPKFLTYEELAKCIGGNAEVLMVEYNEQVKVYPKTILLHHQVINDSFEEEHVIITYSPFSDSYAAFEAGDKIFGVSGRLFAGNTLMFDFETESLWLQLNGESVIGNLTGEKLTQIPTTISTLEKVAKKAPEAKYLSFETGYIVNYSKNPYEIFQKTDQTFGEKSFENLSINPKDKIIGIDFQGEVKAYTLVALEKLDLVDQIGDLQVKVFQDRDLESFEVLKVIDEENESYELIPSIQSYAYTWISIYPESTILSE